MMWYPISEWYIFVVACEIDLKTFLSLLFEKEIKLEQHRKQ